MPLPEPTQHYSTDLNTPNQMGPQAVAHEPFTAYLSVFPDPASGRRFESVRDLEKIAAKIEAAFLELRNSTDCDITISTPIAFTPQFGQFGAKLTVHGTFETSNPNVQRLEPRVVTHTEEDDFPNDPKGSGSGPGGSPQEGNDPTSDFYDNVKALKACIDSVISDALSDGILIRLLKLSLNNIMFGSGKNGIHFPQ